MKRAAPFACLFLTFLLLAGCSNGPAENGDDRPGQDPREPVAATDDDDSPGDDDDDPADSNADPATAASPHEALNYIHDKGFGGVIIRPQALLAAKTFDPVRESILETLRDAPDMDAEIAKEVEWVAITISEPEPGSKGPLLSICTVVHCSTSKVPDREAKKWEENLNDPDWRDFYEKAPFEGGFIYKNDFGSANYRIDETTIMHGDEQSLRRALETAKKPAGSKLRTRLASLDLTAPVVAAYVKGPGSEALFTGLEKDPNMPPDVVEAVKLVQSASAIVTPDADQLVAVNVAGADKAAATKLLGAITKYQGIGGAGYGGFVARFKRSPAGELLAPFLDFGGDFIMSIQPEQKGNAVVVIANRPEGLDELLAKAPPVLKKLKVDAEKRSHLLSVLMLTTAFVSYKAVKGKWPGNFQSDPEGEPELSWRVGLYPFVRGRYAFEDIMEIYNEKPQSWDSPALAEYEDTPSAYSSPGIAESKTRIMMFYGKDAILPDNRSSNISDGRGNTILYIEVGPEKAVPWMKPADIPFDAENPAAAKTALGEPSDGGWLAGFADGTFRRISADIDPADLKALITPDGGETIENLDEIAPFAGE